MTEYIQVDRDQLRVGMRFDYRCEHEAFDAYERRITAISATDGIEYDWVRPSSGRKDRIAMTWDEFEDRTFWVHPDDLHVDEPATASGWETTNEIVARTHDAAYEKGVRDGYLKAQQEQGADRAAEATRHRLTREDALTWAIQALTGSHDGSVTDLIPLAQQIERYVNGNDAQEKPPVMDGGFLPVGTRVEVQFNGRNVPGVIDEVDPDVYHVKADDGTCTTYFPATALRVTAEAGA